MRAQELEDRAKAATDLRRHLRAARQLMNLAHDAAFLMLATPDIKAAISRADKEMESAIKRSGAKLARITRKQDKLTKEPSCNSHLP